MQISYSFPRKNESKWSNLQDPPAHTEDKPSNNHSEILQENVKLKDELDSLKNQSKVQELLIKSGYGENDQTKNLLE